MKTVKTSIDDSTYRALVRMRKNEGVPSVSALFLKKCGVLNEEKEAREIVKRALRIVSGQDSGFEFRLRDLFSDEQWEDWRKGARLRAGRMFYAEVATATKGIRVGRKSGSGHQYYQVA